jgi:alpha-1,2-mannosyltransferase
MMKLIVFALAILACARALLLSYLFVFPLADATAYLAAARVLARGGDIYAVRPVTIPPPYLYPPVLAWLLQPTALVSPLMASYIWITVLGVCVCALIALFARLLPLPVAAVGVLAFVPTWDAVWLGQIDLALACLVVYAITSRRAGIALGIAALLKITPSVALLYLLARRQWRQVFAACVVGVLALLIIQPPALWLRGLLSPGETGSNPYIVSLPFVLGRELGAFGAPLAYLIVGALAVALLLRPLSPPWTISLAMLLPVIGAPIAWVHTATLALPALALLYRESPKAAMVLWLAISILPPSWQPITLVALMALSLFQSVRPERSTTAPLARELLQLG